MSEITVEQLVDMPVNMVDLNSWNELSIASHLVVFGCETVDIVMLAPGFVQVVVSGKEINHSAIEKWFRFSRPVGIRWQVRCERRLP